MKSSFARALAWSIVIAGATGGSVSADDWPQWLGPQRDGVWRETGIIENFPAAGPKIRWRAPMNMGYSGPAVAGNRVYVTDRTLSAGAKNPKSGFARPTVAGTERVLCLDDADGKLLWKHEYPCEYKGVSYPAGPRTTPLIRDGKVYTLGTMGDLLCLDAATGDVVWSKNFLKDYDAKPPLWGFSSSPLLDGDRLICLVGGEGSVVVAFHKDTGKEIWKALSAAEPGYSPPMIFDSGGHRQLIIWHPEAVNSLDPATGKLHWSVPFAVRAGLTAPMARQAGDLLFVSSFYNGSMMLKLAGDKPAATVLWKGKSNSEQARLTDGLHSIIATPIIRDGYIYGVCSYGELRCLKADTGERVWMSLKATGSQEQPVERWANAFLVSHEDRFFLANEKGDLIIARLTPKGYEEIGRAHILEPTNTMIDRPVVWSHPAFAHRSMYARNDNEIVCVSLAAEGK
jgi:outer membrane protein assembly factor BamB